ncbi:hypothetical protein [Thiococcus pfennigii]|uniref:hypothetical protein n=1 Tax=Thiococcus pfennigii TaxID=1057 RepID=UPI001908F4BD|nr:hypothetical protein [Thiococcus pfennigii]MBK1732903.1 hypothetical protein [Thiococcus pfennigii]
MNDRLDAIIRDLLAGDAVEIGLLSTGERCFVALAADRYDLLPTAYADPIEAWHRLDRDWRLAVCAWRGWPEHYAMGA